MDNREQWIEKKVRRTLSALDSADPAKTDDYFYTRLRARLDREEEKASAWSGVLLRKPAWLMAAVLMILSLEAIWLFREGWSATDVQSAESFVEYYQLQPAYPYQNDVQ